MYFYMDKNYLYSSIYINYMCEIPVICAVNKVQRSKSIRNTRIKKLFYAASGRKYCAKIPI